MNRNRYQQGKERARNAAIEWQAESSERVDSWMDLINAAEYFTKLAKRYGLRREFIENGIPVLQA